jgi:hypothetical protein
MREDTRRQVLYRHLLRSRRGRSADAGSETTLGTVEANFSAVLACTPPYSLERAQSRNLTPDD